MDDRLIGRRSFVVSGLAGVACAAAAAAVPRAALAITRGRPGRRIREWQEAFSNDPLALEETTIADLQAAMASGHVSAHALVEQYFARIDAVDVRGPTLRSVLERNPDALSIADGLDAERRSGRVRGPMHGIPVLLKDNIATADRMQSTAGSLALVGAAVPRDAFIAKQLRSAGAVVLGKANLSEWANFRSTHASSGWSGRGGQTLNPYALDRTPSGSSSGSAVAIAANMCAVAVGSETDGSIVSPSAACSLVGLKPTVGLLSRAGIIPISHNQDTPGPIARTVRDAAILLAAMVGPDDRDPATAASRGRAQADYTIGLDPGGLRGARIGVARKHFFGYSDVTDRLIADALEVMGRQGAVLVDPADIDTAGQFDEAELTVLLYDFKEDLNRYLADLGAGSPIHTMADAIAFNSAHRDTEMPYFGQELMLQAETKGPLTDKAYRKALDRCRKLSRSEGIDRTMDRYRLDAIVAPTQGPPWLTDLVNGDPSNQPGSTTPAAVAGYPSITVPAGFAFGLPIGVSFMGRPFAEATLIRLAYAFEQATHVRRPPTFAATADVNTSSH